MKLLMLSAAMIWQASARAASSPSGHALLPKELQGIGIEQRLGAQVPLETVFTNAEGEQVPLRTYFSGRPVLLTLVYYTCPMLCSQILNGVVSGLRPLRVQPGRDFDVVAISINPSETAADAAEKQNFYSRRYWGHAESTGWHFLVGTQAAIDSVTAAAGFHYRWDPASKMFIHASGVMVLTPGGKLARYFYGVQYEPKDLKLGLIEASGNKIGAATDQILLFCYHYDPATGKYSATVLNLLHAAAVLFLVFSGMILTFLFRREIRHSWHTLRGAP
jgi:protein SCO1/2